MIKFIPNENTKKAYYHFVRLFNNVYAAAGMTGVLYYHTGIDPEDGFQIYGYFKDGKVGNKELEDFEKIFVHDRIPVGIKSWENYPRKRSLINMSKIYGMKPWELDAQLNYISEEMSGQTYKSFYEKMKTVASVREAVQLVCNGYFGYDPYYDPYYSGIIFWSSEFQEACENISMSVWNEYADEKEELRIPVKYATTEESGVWVKSEKKNTFPFIRKRLGTLTPKENYKVITTTENGKEYIILYKEMFGYVSVNDVDIFTRMELIGNKA